ncbi:hypothetical protein PS627_03566 [Pseudomonas fluorescens]|uniref:ArsR/SmtB family transcription factor n=1 Tax=Pseudomonas fluorescens TaxID=294 RepID=UPI001259CB9E|nr:helix-turn-helix transcriptional regulator [Pseudomonas fluorescens]CAG8869493.1 hypothetical protein PS627_03566 [Pseudomonas fluorescens]VVP95634.1 hypothetical protein PS910_03314 [Pseudomonas fluorescens]
MKAVTSISQIAGLLADPKRCAMLWALIDGSARRADEIAVMTGLTCSSACAHLSLLSAGGLLRLEARGRKRYFRLANPEVGAAVEALASVQIEVRSPKGGRTVLAPLNIPFSMRRARRCGDHLGGELAADLYQRLLEAGWLVSNDGHTVVSVVGRDALAGIGFYIDALAPGQQSHCVTCNCCSEWTDRRPHLGGSLGLGLFKLFLQSGWIREQKNSRALQISAAGLGHINRIARPALVSTLV